MKLTTKGNYAISALMELVKVSNKQHMSLKVIADRLDLSENYLRQLFMQLRKAGIVESVRGVGGGYFLAKPLDEITVLDVIVAVEGDINVVPCLGEEKGMDCQRMDSCSARNVWMKLNNHVMSNLESLSLANLISEFDLESEKTNGKEL
jgi:Rrf2 family protein